MYFSPIETMATSVIPIFIIPVSQRGQGAFVGPDAGGFVDGTESALNEKMFLGSKGPAVRNVATTNCRLVMPLKALQPDSGRYL